MLREVVLIGGGHSHVGVLHLFAMRPLPGVRLTVICTDTDTPYSGMLPGYIAGHYSFDEVHIDLRRLAEFAGARYYRAEVTGIDRSARQVFCRDRPPVPYEVLSINIGSTPRLDAVAGAAEHVVPVKPIRRFNEHWLALLDRVRRHAGTTTIAVVGAGAGGVELILAMQFRLRNELLGQGRNPDELRCHLFSAEAQILPTHNAAARHAFEAVLAARGVVVHRSAKVSLVSAGHLQTESGEALAVDEIVWVTQAGGAAWLRDTGLALDESGFIRVCDTLQSETDPLVFAAGDCAAMIGRPLEKAGVFAVRMARPLAENLGRTLTHQPLVRYRPQRRWLALISTGDKHAVATRGRLYARGNLVWIWKDWIDRRFMRKFTELAPLAAARPGSGAIPLDDPWLFDRIAANHASCDDFATVLRKDGMRPGDVLILTKPIGTGTLFAAHAQLKARGRWIDAALDSMQVSNGAAVPCLIAHGATACTDLTGLALLNHLVEMTRPSGVDAELELDRLPILEGARETVAAGILSSLQPANLRQLRRTLKNQAAAIAHPNYPLLFDPQTAGGLLASVPAQAADACVDELRGLGYPMAARIGRVLARGEEVESIGLVV